MPFREAVFHDSKLAKIKFCDKCGKRFVDNEKIFKKITHYSRRQRLRGYYCEECYESERLKW